MSALAIGIGLSVVGAGAPSAEAAGAVASRPVPLTVDELTRTGAFSLFSSVGSLSSDGRWLAYAVRSCNPPAGGPAASMHAANGMRASNAGCSDLWVMDTKSGVTERVSDGRGNAEDAEWSPDGRRLAYYAAPDGTAGVWVWDRETRKTRRLGTSIARPSYAFYAGRPQWTPDGKFVAALVLAEGTTVARANDRIHARETPEIRRDPTIAPGAHVSVFRAAATPTGSLSPTPGGSEVATDKGDDPIRRETSDLAAVLMCDVALIDAATGETRHVAVDKGLFWYAPSPDGKWLAWSHMTGYRQKMAARTYDIEVAPVGGGPARVLAKDVYPDDGICSWSPDGRELAYLTGQDGDAVADVHVLDVASGADRRLNPKAVPGKASWENRLVGLWTPDARSLIFVRKGGVWRISRDGGPPAQVGSPDSDLEIIAVLADPSGNFVSTGRAGQTLLVSTRRRSTKDMGFWRVELATGRMTKLREEPRDYGYPVPLASSGGSFIVFRSQDARHPEDLWGGAGADLSAARQLTHLNPGLEKVEFGATRLVGYTGAAGESLQAALLLPAGYREGTRVPLIAEVYAGDSKHSNNVNRFGFGNTSGPFNMQMLATRGYAVLFPETPQKIGTPMRDLVANTNLALDAVVSMGIADPDRLGVMGHSYGGYSTIALVTQTQRFKAAVMSSGIADLVSMYGELQDSGLDSWVDWAENGQGALGGTPWQYRERYIENSPFFYLDRVTTPVLILHGSADRSVPVFHGGQVFSALRRLGREVEFRKYDGEGHVLEGRENIVDYWNAVIRWFDGHVKNPASGAKP
jgi:dipeptidyl aminopeptidase/acylaminoacyl peptidase